MTWGRSSIHVALAASLCVNFWLGHRLVRLEGTVRALTDRPALQIGGQAPDLQLATNAGAEVRIRYSDATVPTVLYIVSPTCKWCARNVTAVGTLAHVLEKRARFLGISVSVSGPSMPLSPTETEHTFPVYTGLSEAAKKQLHLRSTPTTILVSTEGLVMRVWEGAYEGSTRTSLEKYFRVQLPKADLP